MAQAKTRIWGLNTLEYHDSVNTLTFASYQRQMLLSKPAEELEARWAAMPDKIRVRKMLDLMENGARSAHVPVALGRLQRMCAEMEEALAGGPWLMGADYGLADALVTAYFFRIDCIGMQMVCGSPAIRASPTGMGGSPRARRWMPRQGHGLMRLPSTGSARSVGTHSSRMRRFRIICKRA